MGQIYVLLFALVVIAWLAFQHRQWVWAGLAIGVLVAIKPVFGLWPMFLLVGGAMAPALLALGLAGGLWLLPLVVSGPGIYREWLLALSAQAALLPCPGNSSLPAVADRLGAQPIGYVLAGALTLGLLIYVRRGRPDALTVSTLGLIAAILVGPLSWVGYLVVLVPAFWRSWSQLLAVAALILLVPFWLLSRMSTFPTLSLYIVPVLVLLVVTLWPHSSRTRAGWDRGMKLFVAWRTHYRERQAARESCRERIRQADGATVTARYDMCRAPGEVHTEGLCPACARGFR